MKSFLLAVSAAAGIAWAAGCVSAPPAPSAGLTGDSDLAAAVRQRLSADTVTRPYVVGVAAARGRVTLSGAMPTEARVRAVSIAQGTQGVRSVEDRMTDRSAVPTTFSVR